MNSPRLLLPQLQHDEWLVGYLGRMRVLNGLKPKQLALRTALRAEAARRNVSGEDVYELVSATLGVPFSNLVAQNTVIPYRTLFAYSAARDWRLSPDLRAVVSAPLVKHHRFCPTCAERELDEQCYSIWHLHHQYAGVMRCWICGEGLAGIECIAYLTLPHLVSPSVKVHAYASDHLDGDAIQRHKELTIALLERSSLPSLATLASLLSQRAQLIGLRCGQDYDSSKIRERCWPYMQLYAYETESILMRVLRGKGNSVWAALVLLLGLSNSTTDALSIIDSSAGLAQSLD